MRNTVMVQHAHSVVKTFIANFEHEFRIRIEQLTGNRERAQPLSCERFLATILVDESSLPSAAFCWCPSEAATRRPRWKTSPMSLQLFSISSIFAYVRLPLFFKADTVWAREAS